MSDRFESILLVGCGNMAGAMLRGWLAGGLAPDRFTVADPAMPPLPEGVTVLDAVPAARTFDAVLLGVKPQLLPKVAAPVAQLAGPDTTVLSLLAGVDLETLEKTFARAGAVYRVMPNLAVELGKAPIALAGAGLDEAGRAALAALLAPLGSPEWVEEGDFDLVTALAGSGPGFVYRFIEALAVAAADLGLDRAQADRLSLAMVEGAAALAAASPHDPGELARRVASPGGMTQEGLDVLDRDHALVGLLKETLRAARDRGAELAAAARANS
ncbi:pyrroline-5-carboxylate reductase family protein [Tsuneonella sp. HG222]